MTSSLKAAEEMVRRLVERANRAHDEAVWSYELTSEVDNIEVSPGAGTRTLRIHPCWLRYVVAQGEFTSCVAEEIEAWCLLERLTGRVSLSCA
jgi:hypothetical protein